MTIDKVVNGAKETARLVVHLPQDKIRGIKNAWWSVTRQNLNGIDSEQGRLDNFSPGAVLTYERQDGNYRVILEFPQGLGQIGRKNVDELYGKLLGVEGAYIPIEDKETTKAGLHAIGYY